MTETRSSPSALSLQQLLETSTSGLGEDVLLFARSIGPERAREVVVGLIERQLAHPTISGTATRAAHLAGALRLVSAAPVLVRCVEGLPGTHPLRSAALAALTRLGDEAVELILAAFGQAATAGARAQLADAFGASWPDDGRIRDALVALLHDDPVRAAPLLAGRGEWRAVGELVRVFDAVTTRAVGDCGCAICARKQLRAISPAIRALGGAIDEEQGERFDAVIERADAERDTVRGSLEHQLASLEALRERISAPSRNAPCHCGSGKKYKKCHLLTEALR